MGTEWVIAAFTFGLLLVAALQYAAFVQTKEHNLTVQRAYVDMSHQSPPGLALHLDGPNPFVRATIVVKNHGATPGTVTQVYLTAWVDADDPPDVPEFPDYPIPTQPQIPTEAFLMTQESFTTRFDLPLNPDELHGFLHQHHQLVLIGYVDYRDQFEREYRSGYARRYTTAPLDPQNNLVFFLKKGYNYDRRLNAGPSWYS